VCVGDPSRLRNRTPSTTAVEPALQGEPRSQAAPVQQAGPQPEAAPVQQTRPQPELAPVALPYPYAQPQLQSGGQPLLDTLGVTALLRDLLGR